MFTIGTAVIYNGKYVTVVGRDSGVEMAIIEFCDWQDGKCLVVHDADLVADEDEVE